MNIFGPSSEVSRAELEELSTPVNNMIGHQGGKPDVGIVQDGLTGAYLMTGGLTTSLKQVDEEIPRHVFYNICAQLDNMDSEKIQNKLELVQQVYREMASVETPLYSGKTLFSLLLPDDFIYSMKDKSDDRYSVKIYRGVMYKGVLTKAHLGKGHQSLITILHSEYPINVVYDFINNIQWMANHFLLYHGFSIGISDCVATKLDEIDDACMKSFIEAEEIENSTTNEFIKEVKIGMALGKARDTGMKIAKEALAKTNNFLTTVSSGSKGDFFNIAQITGIVGQQNIGGGRMRYELNHGTRALPHYPKEKLTKCVEYESKGFIKSSFIKGLSPKEYWFHSVSSRESLTDTSTKTASSGYTQRKMIKIMEDVQVKYDGTVRNSVGSIIQFAYGSDNLDGSVAVVLGNEPHICDIQRMADRINLNHECRDEIY
jgi:DNA-directed RNA polymerase II subunit RPB1